MKKRNKFILGGGIAVILVMTALVAPIMARMPFPQADRVQDGALVGVEAGGSFAWIIPTASGVVLIDVGWDTDAAQIRAEVGDRQVMAILLTHAHFDHTGGLSAFPDAPVYVGPDEEALLRGQAKPKGWMARVSTSMMAPPPPNPTVVIEIIDGQEIEIDGAKIRAFHTQGHTGGSAMYIWNKTLFSGDAIVGRGAYVSEIPKPTSDDYDQIRTNIAKVLDYPFDRMADGHVGLHKGIRAQVETYVNGR